MRKLIHSLIVLLSFVALDVRADTTGPIATVDSTTWKWADNENDYLASSYKWTDCPDGYVMTDALVTRYTTKNKNISNIKCTKVAGLSGPTYVKELYHRMSYRLKYGNPACETAADWSRFGYYCQWKTSNLIDPIDNDGLLIDHPYPGPGIGHGINICPKGMFITGVLKRRDTIRDKNITMIKCRQITGILDWNSEVINIPDDSWISCPAGKAAVGLITLNHAPNGSGNDTFDSLSAVQELVWFYGTSIGAANIVGIVGQQGVIMEIPGVLKYVSFWGDDVLKWIFGNADTRNYTERGVICIPVPVQDKTPPQISFLAPTTGAKHTTTAASISITATATDNGGISNINFPFLWANNLTQIGGQMSCLWGHCVAHNVALKFGLNTITVATTDKGGNSATKSIVIERIRPPKCVIRSRGNKSQTTVGAKFDVIWKATNADTIVSTGWKAPVNCGSGGNCRSIYMPPHTYSVPAGKSSFKMIWGNLFMESKGSATIWLTPKKNGIAGATCSLTMTAK